MAQRSNTSVTDDPRSTVDDRLPVPRRRRRSEQIIEIEEVERIGDQPPKRAALAGRAWRAFAPTLLGILIDLGDLASVSPMLAPVSFPVGCLIGFIWSGFLNVSLTWRIAITLGTGAYFVAPFTSMIPVATVVGTVAQIFDPKLAGDEPA